MRRLGVVVAFAVALMATVPADAAGTGELDDVRREIADLTRQIDNNRTESRRVGQQLAAAQERLDVVQGRLAAAEEAVAGKETEIAAEEERLAGLQGRLDSTRRSLAETQAEIRTTASDIEMRAVDMYMDASSSKGALVLDFDSISSAAIGLTYASRAVAVSEDVLSRFEALLAEGTRQEAALEEDAAALEESIAALEVEKAELDAEKAQVEELRNEEAANLSSARSLLRTITAAIAAAEEHKDGLEADAARLQRELAGRKSTGVAPGTLGWPVNGRVTSPFGYRIHPILGTRKLHTGIDFGAATGAPIAAAGDGIVVIAGPYGGYGNAVVIDHGGGLATLYAHQSVVKVSVRATVSRGQTIGAVGCTGLCTGPHLHFETRVNGVPVNPTTYLGG